MKKIMISYTTEKPQGYQCGSLFSDCEIRQRLIEDELINNNTNINYYSPINAPVNDKSKLPTADDIFNMDTEKILKSNIVTADLSNRDEGQSFELGIAWMCNYMHHLVNQGYSLENILTYIPKKKVYAHLSDIRKSTSHKYEGNYIPWGVNAYLIGGVEQIGKIYEHFEDALEDIKKEV